MFDSVNVLPIVRNVARSFFLAVILALLAGITIRPAQAQVIERIEIIQAGDEAEIQIQFVTRVQYLRQAALKNGDIRLYFNLMEIDALDPRLTFESTNSPPSNIAPRFTVSYPELDSSLTIRFGKLVDYRVRPGKDGRSISIFVPAIKHKIEPPPKAQLAPPIKPATPAALPPITAPPVVAPPVVAPPVVAPPVVAPPIVAPPVAAPPVAVPPVVAPPVAAPPAAAPPVVAPPVAAPLVVAPPVAAPPVAAPPVAAPPVAPPVATPPVAAPPAVAPPVAPRPAAAPPVTAPPVAAPPVTAPPVAAIPPPPLPGAVAPPAKVETAVLPQPETVAALPPAVLRTPEEIELEAMQLIGSARNALKSGRIETAIGTLNRLLNLPPNQQSQVAQEMIGEAREKNGEFAKARVEYELYLKLYPDAANAKQVKERLAQLPKEDLAKAALKVPTARVLAVDEKWQVYGSLAQNYYKGDSQTDTTVITNGLSVATSSLTNIDQSQLISTLDMTGRKRGETTDTRIVLRESHRANFLPGQRSFNRLNAAYYEQSARDKNYLYRLGRQTGSAGGVPGRFDGAWGGYSLGSKWRINGVVGEPVEFTGGGIDSKTFVGMSVDLTRPPEQWSGSTYLIGQRVAGIADRQAVGVEARYFDARHNYLGVIDYDMLFQAVNIAMFQGNIVMENGDFQLLVERRKSPSLQITNALPGHPMQSISALVQSGVSKYTLLADARALSPSSNLLMVGANRILSPRVRLGGDFRITNTSGTGAAGVLPAAPGTGNINVYSLRAIGNDLLFENDLGVASASYIDGRTFKGRSLSFNQVTTWWNYWRLDLALQLYSQSDNRGIQQRRIMPSLKLSYRLSDSVSFEAEGGVEDTRTSSATQNDRILRRYFFIGYRWDFR